jgi:pimeloyl-ACP methyl ester carboxylesterase
VLNGIRFLSAYYDALYTSKYYATLPNVVKSLEKGKLGRFEEILIDWIGYILDRDYSDGAAVSHYCYEEAPLVNFGRARENASVLPEIIREMVLDGISYSETICSNWNIGSGPYLESQPMETDIPTLFLHGELDPVLPVEDLADQARNFTNSVVRVFPGVSHSVIGFSDCVTDITREFFNHKLDYNDYVTCGH